MIGFKHYYNSSELIGTGEYSFRRFSTETTAVEEDSRFIQYVEGRLEEILPEDFGDITTIPTRSLYKYLLTDTLFDTVSIKVELPNTVTTIEDYALSHSDIKEVIFSENISTIGNFVLNGTDSDCVLDFSKAKNIPTITIDSESGEYKSLASGGITTIKVPTNLYSAWKNKADWSHVSDKLIAV